MSTLPFLLSVADELDNINSQSYMDDFGLGFHPHRQFYRTPTIQLSLPAGTDWMDADSGRQRCRIHKFVDESQNNLPEEETEERDEAGNGTADTDKYGASTSAAAAKVPTNRQKFTSALNSNGEEIQRRDVDNIDNAVQMHNLSKKCCKNYYRHGITKDKSAAEAGSATGGGYKLHTKCMEGNNSSSEESLQKVSSSIEFLTCFLLKKTRASKHHSPSGESAVAGSSSSSKKS